MANKESKSLKEIDSVQVWGQINIFWRQSEWRSKWNHLSCIVSISDPRINCQLMIPWHTLWSQFSTLHLLAKQRHFLPAHHFYAISAFRSDCLSSTFGLGDCHHFGITFISPSRAMMANGEIESLQHSLVFSNLTFWFHKCFKNCILLIVFLL